MSASYREDVLLRQLDEKVVSFKPNFDASEVSPLEWYARHCVSSSVEQKCRLTSGETGAKQI